MLGYPCCPAVQAVLPASSVPFQALSNKYLLKAEQTCIALVHHGQRPAHPDGCTGDWTNTELKAPSGVASRPRLQVSPQELLVQTTVPIATVHTVSPPPLLGHAQSLGLAASAASSANTVELVNDESACSV